ncbi:hypothetical protein OO015_00960 [Thermomicrobium sp. 4228-Ro]|uniref:hypothetical protein n=1 Tax=Thermomicrobium sp. 4228-Ro TaxID=2993937 RepID=UPI0022490A26|nr:hypothetical protein [Thermomicrobium sp. 4228-Ro]MCX2726073.1 hypothetical protein [Thermomicrobium sp. 4228-Ro]
MYDRSPQEGTWLVNVVSGERRRLGSWYGAAGSGRAALLDPDRGVTTLLDWSGRVLDEFPTGRTVVTLSPDGRYLAWLESRSERLPSSFVAPVSTVIVFDTIARHSYRLGELRVAGLVWAGAGDRLLVLGESPDGSVAGVWLAEAPWNDAHPVLTGRFFVDLRVVPDSSAFFITRVLSGSVEDDGVWLVDPATGDRRRVPIEPAYRPTSAAVWVLDAESGSPRLRAYQLDTFQPCASALLTEPVLAETWEVAPDGRWIAYWGALSQHVRVEALPACRVDS